MRRGSGNVIWALALGFGIGIGQAEPAASLTVFVYDYANVSRTKLADAEAFAARSYRAASIELTWVECAVSKADAERFRGCEPAIDGHRLFLEIIPERTAAGIPPSRESEHALGIALVYSAFILYPRVHEMAGVWRAPEYVVLGRTMAHELGHLVLGANSHSNTGLMRPHFDRRDLSLASGQFLFDPQQAKRLRVLLNSRQRQ